MKTPQGPSSEALLPICPQRVASNFSLTPEYLPQMLSSAEEVLVVKHISRKLNSSLEDGKILEA